MSTLLICVVGIGGTAVDSTDCVVPVATGVVGSLTLVGTPKSKSKSNPSNISSILFILLIFFN